MGYDAAERPERSLPLVVGQGQPEPAPWWSRPRLDPARGGTFARWSSHEGSPSWVLIRRPSTHSTRLSSAASPIMGGSWVGRRGVTSVGVRLLLLGPIPVPTRSDSTANRARHDRPGAPRQGPSLLAGLLRCGRCGRRMLVRYSGPAGRHWYGCTRGTSDYAEALCQSLSGPVVDELVAGRVLAAVEPAALEASLAAVAEVERERAELTRHWQLRRERAALRGRAGGAAVPGLRAREPPGRPRAGAALGGGAEVPAAAGGRASRGGSGRPPAGSRPRTSGRSGRWPPTCRRSGGRRRPRPRSGNGSPGS